MFLLEECLKLYKDNFPVEWIDKFSWEDADVENSYTMASMKIKQFQKNCFIYLSKSALVNMCHLKRRWKMFVMN